MGKFPILGVLIGILFTILFQSSSTTIGMVIVLGISGLLDFKSAFFIILGNNIGTCITAIIASIGGNISAKRLAFANIIANTFGVVISFILAPIYFYVIPKISTDIGRQIANAHTLFNVVTVLILLPLIPLLVKFVEKYIKGYEYKKRESKYLEKHLLKTPELAIKAVLKERLEMFNLSFDIFKKVRELTNKFDYKKKEEMSIDEESLDEYHMKITNYIIKITNNTTGKTQFKKIPVLLHSISEIERIGDQCEKIKFILRKKHEFNLEFSKKSVNEISKIFRLCDKCFNVVGHFLKTENEEYLLEVLKISRDIRRFTDEFETNHLRNLKENKKRANLIFMEFLRRLENIGNGLENVCKIDNFLEK
jgi:phosphate:Na+ symporter